MYLTLMRYLWPYGGPMPIDEVEALLGKAWVSLGSIFRRKFVENDGAICLQWMEDEREKQTAFRERQALNGSKGGRPRKAKNPSLSQAKPEPIPKKSPRVGDGDGNGVGISLIEEKEHAQPDTALTVEIWPTFDDWWSLYDKKTGRAPCEAKWKRLKQDEKEAIMRHTEAYVAATPEIQYRKNPLTYLNQKSWNDEHVTRRDDPARPVTAKLERIQRMLAEREHRGAIPQARALGYADGERSE